MSAMNQVEQYFFNGNPVLCPICKHSLFRKRKATLNTKRMLFWELGWLNQDATTYICEQCGHILWFLQKD